MKAYFLSLSAALLLLTHNIFAVDTTDSLSANIIIFKPEVRLQNSEKPCQGVRVSDHKVITSPECAQLIASQLAEHPMMANSYQNVQVGQIALSTVDNTQLGHLVLFNFDSENTSSRYPITTKRPIISEQEVRSVELSSTDGSIISMTLRLSPEENTYKYSCMNNAAPAPGSAVVAGKRLVCIAALDRTCIPIRQNKNLNFLPEEVLLDSLHQDVHKRNAQNSTACSTCQAQLNQLMTVCQQLCTGKFSYQACALCAKKVDLQAAKCKSICNSK